jgi:hypothetical protein
MIGGESIFATQIAEDAGYEFDKLLLSSALNLALSFVVFKYLKVIRHFELS